MQNITKQHQTNEEDEANEQTNKPRNIDKWASLTPEAKDHGKSKWISIETIKKAGIKWTSNGNQRKGKFLGIKKYKWESKRHKGKVIAIRTVGIDLAIEQAERNKNRPIAKNIRDYYKKHSCISCGKNKSMVIDHKNDLYNDQRVHNIKTQRLDDFQPLCNACNLTKSAVCVKTKKQNKRQAAPFEYTSLGFPNFIEGDETFNPDGLGMRGTYWYDVKLYKEHCKNHIILQKSTSINIEKEKEQTYDKVCSYIKQYCKKKNLYIDYIARKLLNR